jgi:chromate transporter
MSAHGIALSERERKPVTLAGLFATFAWISTTAFGGAGVAAMRRAFITERQWLTEREFIEIYGIAQVSPGAIPVSLAVLIGRRLAGTPGFLVCLVAETVPGFIVLLSIAILSMNPHMSVLRAALKGCAAAAVGMLLGNSIELTWPYRTKIVDIGVLVAVGVAVLVLHASLGVMFAIFIPLSIVLQRLVRAE